jgi:hypothetical protein
MYVHDVTPQSLSARASFSGSSLDSSVREGAVPAHLKEVISATLPLFEHIAVASHTA